MATKANKKRPGERLSMGYGFVQYLKAADAKRALKELQVPVPASPHPHER